MMRSALVLRERSYRFLIGFWKHRSDRLSIALVMKNVLAELNEVIAF
jgi:hypothetical protein